MYTTAFRSGFAVALIVFIVTTFESVAVHAADKRQPLGGLTGLGYWIDLKKGTGPWGVLIGLCLGFVGGTYNFIRAAQRAARENAARAAEEREGEGP